MKAKYPIYTVKTECQDCYKCVRHCPVKAIRVEGNHATVIPELCVACGNCVAVCPVNAKRIRDDVDRTKLLLNNSTEVFVSLAPSWVSEFPNLKPERMIAALKKLGFKAVSETALGAEIVSEEIAKTYKNKAEKLQISSACPVCVDYINKYLPDLSCCVSDLLSPALAHCRMLREEYGNEIRVVFIGPCIAKKNEADRRPDLMDIALTFGELRRWFEDAGVNLNTIEAGKDDEFVPHAAHEGKIYPVTGGMNRTIKLHDESSELKTIELDGLANFENEFGSLKPYDIKDYLFVEILACVGGCINGPATDESRGNLINRLRIENTEQLPCKACDKNCSFKVTGETIETEPVVKDREISLVEINEALKRVGKVSKEDELNCGGCGYDSCREFAKALIKGNC